MCSLASCAADFLSSSSSNTLKPSTSIASLSSPSEPSFSNGRAAFLCDSRRSGALSIPVRASPRFGSLGSSFGLPDRAETTHQHSLRRQRFSRTLKRRTYLFTSGLFVRLLEPAWVFFGSSLFQCWVKPVVTCPLHYSGITGELAHRMLILDRADIDIDVVTDSKL